MASTNALSLEKELIRSIKGVLNRIDVPKKSKPLKTYNLEIAYQERLLNGKVRDYTSREQIKASSLGEAKSKLYDQVVCACMEAHRRKDILSFGVYTENIKSYKP